MPVRILRPWTDSERVNALSEAAEVFFIRLIMCADDYGRYTADPRLLKSYLYPLRDTRAADIPRLIAECERAGVLASYVVNGKRYLEIRRFGQRTRTAKSKYPAPVSQPDGDCQAHDGHMSDRCQTDVSHMSVICQSYVRQMSDRCRTSDRHMTARDGDGDGDGDEREIPPPPYPETADEVIALAAKAGAVMDPADAEMYLADRQRKGWTPTGAKLPIPPGRVPADAKMWALRTQNDRKERERKEGGRYADGKHLPERTDYGEQSRLD